MQWVKRASQCWGAPWCLSTKACESHCQGACASQRTPKGQYHSCQDQLLITNNCKILISFCNIAKRSFTHTYVKLFGNKLWKLIGLSHATPVYMYLLRKRTWLHSLTERSDVQIAVQFRGKAAWSERQLLKKAPRENQNQVFIHYDPRDVGKKYLADFFPLRGGGAVPPNSAKLFWAEWFSVKGPGKTVPNNYGIFFFTKTHQDDLAINHWLFVLIIPTERRVQQCTKKSPDLSLRHMVVQKMTKVLIN